MDITNNIKRAILSFLELRKLEEYDSRFMDLNDRNISIMDQIKSDHDYYIKNISTPKMALSFELAKALFCLCTHYQPKRILDLGSGFSSYVFRTYKGNSSNTQVFSVDDNSDWLQKTKGYLDTQNLSTQNLFSLEDFINLSSINSFDLVLLDLNLVEIRINYLNLSIDLLNENGILIIDDAHKIDFIREVKKIAKNHSGTLYSFKKSTLDKFGRFSLIYKKSQ